MIEPPEILTTWAFACVAYFDDGLVVLGPKCRSVDCLEPAIARVYWPSGAFVACERCTAGCRRIADAMGVALHVEAVWYQRGGLSDAEQRFRLLELT